jgi:hypothetical protein
MCLVGASGYRRRSAGTTATIFWGPRGHDGSVMIAVGGDTHHYDEVFTSHEVAGHTDTPYAMPYESNQPIYVLRGLKSPLPEFPVDGEELQLMSQLPGEQEFGMVGSDCIGQVVNGRLKVRRGLRIIALLGLHTPEHEPRQARAI